jgi:predicted nucleic acid-binding protein
MIVLDASAAIELLLRSSNGELVEALIEDPDETLHAPHLLDVEVTQVLRRLCRDGTVSAKRAALALDRYAELRIARYDHSPLLARVWSLRDSLTAYDASYVALAERLAARLVTFDERLAKAKHRAAVVLPRRA